MVSEMIKASIRNPEYFEVLDENTNEKYCGCNQEWYKKAWKRMAGCGPTAAANIIMYYRKEIGTGKNNCVKLMNEMWEYITPTMRGVNTTNVFYKGLVSFADSKGIKLLYDAVDVPEKKEIRPAFKKIINFIKNSLENDVPLAFLNLCNGEEKLLDKWHWVTLISIEFEEDLSKAYAEILDEGMKKTINLLLWYKTTTLGGGFISFSFAE
jgi:hypothetical protein